MKFLIIDLRADRHRIAKTNFVGEFLIKASNRGEIQIIDIEAESTHIIGDQWAPINEVNHK